MRVKPVVVLAVLADVVLSVVPVVVVTVVVDAEVVDAGVVVDPINSTWARLSRHSVQFTWRSVQLNLRRDF